MSAPGLRPEAELLLAALSVGAHAGERLRAAVAQPALDWSWIAERADVSRVAALVADALARAGLLEAVPAEERAQLQARHRGARLRHVAHLGELAALARSLAPQGMELLAYKGPALAELLYPEPGLREYADLDVLARPADLGPVRALLRERGWEPLVPREGRAWRRHLGRDCEEVFAQPAQGRALELHWRLLPANQPQRLELEDLLRRAGRARWAGAELRILEPIDLLLALCHHAGEKHRWMRLQMVADVARFLVKHRALPAGELWERARAARLEDCLLVGLHLAWTWLDAPLAPELAARAAASTRARAQAALARGRVFRAEGGLAGRREWSRYVAALIERERALGIPDPQPLGTAAWLRELATPDWADRQSLPLPRALHALHWGWRPLRLALRTGATLPARLR